MFKKFAEVFSTLKPHSWAGRALPDNRRLPKKARTEDMAPTATMTMEQAAELLSREERFMATVSAMNALMIAKGIYTADEVEAFYVQWAMNQQARPKRQRPGWHSRQGESKS